VALDGNAVFVDFSVERLAQGDNVSVSFGGGRFGRRSVEPELHPIKKVKSAPVDHVVPSRLIFGAKEDRC
jgi:hypothetical protein